MTDTEFQIIKTVKIENLTNNNLNLTNNNLNFKNSKSKSKKDINCYNTYICTNNNDIKKISKVSAVIIIFMLIELWGHYKTKSLSLLADALHLLVDISGFIISILTLAIARNKSNSKMTWGYQRVEILGALLSIILIWIAVGYLLLESFKKYMHPQNINGNMFLSIAIMGLIVNLGCMYILHVCPDQHNHHQNQNLNIRAAYIHIIGDVIQSIGVIIASIIIYFKPSFVIVDVICTLFFGILVMISTFYILKDAINILLEGAPKNINQKNISEFILKEECVVKIIDMKIWSLGVNKHAIIIKILVNYMLIKEYEELLVKIREFLEEIIDVDGITIQIETPRTYEEWCKPGIIGGLPLCQNDLKYENI